jgi:hypothetical protein
MPSAITEGRSEVGWVFLEVLAALLIAVGIVWWTLPKAPKAGVVRAQEERADDPSQRKGDDTEPKETGHG